MKYFQISSRHLGGSTSFTTGPRSSSRESVDKGPRHREPPEGQYREGFAFMRSLQCFLGIARERSSRRAANHAARAMTPARVFLHTLAHGGFAFSADLDYYRHIILTESLV